MSPKYGLEEIKIMVKLVHSRISKEQIKMVLQLGEYGINKDNVDQLYDTLADDIPNDQTPPSSQPRFDSAVVDFDSPPSSQGYPAAICSDNESNNRPSEIDSPPYTDEDQWSGLPKEPNYTPRYFQNGSIKNHKGDHNDSNSTTTTVTTVITPTNNHTSTSEKRTRDRFVFRTIHQDILNTAFFSNAYPENDEKEILVDQCNKALENYKGGLYLLLNCHLISLSFHILMLTFSLFLFSIFRSTS